MGAGLPVAPVLVYSNTSFRSYSSITHQSLSERVRTEEIKRTNLDIPNTHLTIVGASCKVRAKTRSERKRVDVFGVASEGMKASSSISIPQPRCRVERSTAGEILVLHSWSTKEKTYEASNRGPVWSFSHGPQATVCTSESCPSKTNTPMCSLSSTILPSSFADTLAPRLRPGILRRDHTRTVLSSEHDARRVPQGENFTTFTSSR